MAMGEKPERDDEWLKEGDKSAEVLRQTLPVMVYEYAIGAVDVKKQEEIRESIKEQEQNRKLYSGLVTSKVERFDLAEKTSTAGMG